MASIASQDRDLSWRQMVSVDQLNSVCPRSSFTLKALTPSFQTMSDSASASTLVDDDVRYEPHSISFSRS